MNTDLLVRLRAEAQAQRDQAGIIDWSVYIGFLLDECLENDEETTVARG
jgi:hypothetical protein